MRCNLTWKPAVNRTGKIPKSEQRNSRIAMNAKHETPEQIQTLLVAYLDGELSGTQRQEIERRLAKDGAFRNQLSTLQKSWDLLDCLPRSAEDKKLTQTTIAMVARDQQRQVTSPPRPSAPVVSGRWVSAALALVIGFVAVSVPLRAIQNRQLRDLPVADNLDLYRYADDIEFLRLLNAEGFFPEDDQHAY